MSAEDTSMGEEAGRLSLVPLLVRTDDVVEGDGFLARVQIWGRAIAVLEDDEWWLYGVQPGAIAEGATTAPEACRLFTGAIHNVLEDAASEAAGFDAFRAEVNRFFNQVDDTEQERWLPAAEMLRNGADVEGPFSGLEKKAYTSLCRVKVERLKAPNSDVEVVSHPNEICLPASTEAA